MDGQSSRNRGDRNNVFFGMPSPDLEREVSFIKDELQRRPVLPDVPVIEINTPALYTPPPSPTPIPLANLAGWWDFSDLAYRTLHTGTVGQTYWKWADRSASNMRLAVPNDRSSPSWYNNPDLSSIGALQALFFEVDPSGLAGFCIDDGGPNSASDPSDAVFASMAGKSTTIISFVAEFPVNMGISGPPSGRVITLYSLESPGVEKYKDININRTPAGGTLFANAGYSTGDQVSTTSNLRGSGPVVVTVVFQDTTPHITVRVNGITEGSGNVTTVPTSMSNPQLRVLGMDYKSDATKLGEILVYNYPLSDPEIFQVENYLGTKWGVV